MNNNIYVENGFKNRVEYLKFLSEKYNVQFHIVASLADILGRNEDFDGLVNALEDIEFM